MRIHSFTTMLAMPFILAGGVLLYLMLMEDMDKLYPYLFPIVIILAALYAFHPKIDFWWHKKYPPDLGSKLKKLIYNASPLFQNLNERDRKIFLDRLSIFVHHKGFYLMRKEKEKMPVDMKVLIAINGISLTLGREEFYFDKFDYFIAYQHPFPSPKKRFLHSVEIDHEDGVLLFDSDLLFRHMVVKEIPFNVGMYAFSEIYLVSNPLSDLNQLDEPDLNLLDNFNNMTLEWLITAIGYKEIYAKAVLMALFFSHKEEVQKYYPEFHKVLERELNLP